MKRFLNILRNIILFRLKYPWIKCGRNIHCQSNTTFWSPHRHIVLGNNIGIGYRCTFLCDIEIGDKVLIASDVALVNSDDHRWNIIGSTMWDSGRGDKYSIVIENDVWIGQKATILAPARIGQGAIIAAGSVVNSDVPRYAIMAGVPAKIIRMRFTTEQIMQHENILIQKGELLPENQTFPYTEEITAKM